MAGISYIKIAALVAGALLCLGSSPLAVAASPNIKAARVTTPTVPPGLAAAQYILMQFPPRFEVAHLDYWIPSKDSAGKPTFKQEKSIARGTIRVPTNVQIFLQLQYDGPEHLNTLFELNPPMITQLKAAGLDLDDAQFAYFKRFPNIFRINLDSTLITDKSVPVLASFKQMSDMRISKTELTGQGFEAFSGMPLRILSIEGSNVQEGNLQKIKTLPDTLESLNADRTKLGPSDIAFLSKCRKLQSLDLGGDKNITDACAKDIAKMKMLDVLNISDTLVTEKSLPTLAKMPNLKRLVVRSSSFWILGHGKSPRPSLIIEDAAAASRTPSDVFYPLH